MRKRMLVMLLVAGAVVAGLATFKFLQIRKAVGQSYQPPPEAVTTIVTREESWPASVDAIGTVTAVQGVTVSADLPGMVERIAFESGRTVREGAVLVVLNTSQERAQLAAAEADLHLKEASLQRARQLRQQGIVSQADLDQASAEARQREAAVGEIHATIERKTIRAPFSGVLGIRQVNLGQYLAGGDPIVPLQSLHPIYVDFGVPQQVVAQLQPGAEVRVSAERVPGERPGRITAVDSVVDSDTRNVHVQATLANDDDVLHPGMFVNVRVMTGSGRSVVTVPASAINHAPYGDSVFVVAQQKGPDGKPYLGVSQQFVKVGAGR
ncbi:MAG TPA: efflux RND transporter periplasmic adaptor subunit, partial [Thermoanaerobaculia bacterium]|nr:efflux RND transporter periplasmic adaptor subunit [Thermoanaerobaculia bacterium]